MKGELCKNPDFSKTEIKSRLKRCKRIIFKTLSKIILCIGIAAVVIAAIPATILILIIYGTWTFVDRTVSLLETAEK